MDIDILLFEKEMIDSTALKVPHPQLQIEDLPSSHWQRSQLPYNIRILELTVQELLEQCTDPLQVHRIR